MTRHSPAPGRGARPSGPASCAAPPAAGAATGARSGSAPCRAAAGQPCRPRVPPTHTPNEAARLKQSPKQHVFERKKRAKNIRKTSLKVAVKFSHLTSQPLSSIPSKSCSAATPREGVAGARVLWWASPANGQLINSRPPPQSSCGFGPSCTMISNGCNCITPAHTSHSSPFNF